MHRYTIRLPMARGVVQAHPYGGDLLRVLDRSRFRLEGAVSRGLPGHDVALFVRPGADERILFGTSRLICCYVTDQRNADPNLIEYLQELIDTSLPEVTPSVALIISPSNDLSADSAVHSNTSATSIVDFSINEIRGCRPHGRLDFTRLLQSRYYSRDLYSYRTAIGEADAFFGRQADINESATRLKRSQNHVGIFGLRRMGKTSLLYRIHRKLRDAESAYIAHIDLERIDAIEASVEYFLWALGEAIYDSHRQVRSLTGFRMFGRTNVFSELERDAIVEDFSHDLTYLLREKRRPLVISIDELEMMFPETAISPGWNDAFVRIWRLLRGISQEHERSLSFLVAGTNPRPIEAPRANSADNPIYNWIDIQYLGPLLPDESAALLHQVGERMGLDWSEEAKRYVYSRLAGHPFLTRAFGSLVHESRLPRDEVVPVPASLAQSLLPKFMLQQSSSLEQMLAVLEEHYADEHLMLELLALGRVAEFNSYAAAWPVYTRHLVGYGLVDMDKAPPTLCIEVLQSYIQQQFRSSQGVPERRHIELLPGDVLGEVFRIQSQIGLSGFSEVYLSEVIDNTKMLRSGDRVAVKVLHRGASLVRLQREVEALREVEHPNVVKMYDFGTDITGRHYLVMEYIDGVPMAARCNRAHRLTSPEAKVCLQSLLSALIVIHPDLDAVDSHRESEVRSSSDLEAILKARHGYIHRDIKPENILLHSTRGPVLIDFNISSKAGDPALTQSQTPGYVRPVFFGAKWSPEHDLYALGLTIAQAVGGVPLSDEADVGSQDAAVEDLLTVAGAEADPNLFKVISKLCAAGTDEGYSSAAQALTDLNRA